MATVVMLVVLRVNIGWHFFREGVSHVTDENWSSAGFLRLAKGPLAPKFQAYLPDAYRWEEMMHGNFTADKSREKFGDEVTDSWDQYHGRFNAHYAVTDAQKPLVREIVQQNKENLKTWIDKNAKEIDGYLLDWQRLAKDRQAAYAEEVPYQKQRVAAKLAELGGKSNGWRAEIKAMEQDYHKQLAAVLDDAQRKRGPMPELRTTLSTIDAVLTYGILGIGACLIVGLFARLAAVVGAAFLLSVVLTQPFWITDTQPTFNQFVEMFALLALATTHVGRWGGLDFFIHHFLVQPCCGRKGTNHASDS